jgi:hypothetical protein
VACKEDAPPGKLSQRIDCILQTLAVAGRIARPGRAGRTRLAIRQVAPQHNETRGCEFVGDCD